MKLRVSLLCLLCGSLPIALFAQSVQTKQLLNLEKNRAIFIEGKTTVREVLFSGLDAGYFGSSDVQSDYPVFESDVRATLKYERIDIQSVETLDLKKVGTLIGRVKEYLFERGYFNAKVIAIGQKLARNEMALILSVERGPKSDVSAIRFYGTTVFSEDELISIMRSCFRSGWGTYDLRYINHCAQVDVRRYMQDRGYFKSTISTPSRKFGVDTVEIRFEVTEGIRYRIGDLSIKGNKLFTEREIWEMLKLSKGDIANGRIIQEFAYDRLPEVYQERGYLNFATEFEPTYIPPVAKGLDGFVNIDFVVDEGPEFKFGGITFLGVKDEVASELKSNFPLRSEDVYSQKVVDGYIKKLNDSGRFKPIDPYRDVEVLTSVDEPLKASSDGEPVLRSPRSERKNDIELRVKLTLNKD